MIIRPVLSILITLNFLMVSCVETGSLRSSRAIKDGATSIVDDGVSGPEQEGNGQKATSSDENLIDSLLENGNVELRGFIDPEDGSYQDKVTIPKNYNGILYITGLNVTSLSDKIVSVRFRFGQELSPITVPAVITTGEGITPQTDAQVIALNLRGRPFENLRLKYNLFDYNTYATTTTEVVSDPVNKNLFCRGLDLKYDPTFEASVINNTCDTAGEQCYYAFAKIKDQGLKNDTTDFFVNPIHPQQDIKGDGYSSDLASNHLLKSLPDSDSFSHLNALLNLVSPLAATPVVGTTQIIHQKRDSDDVEVLSTVLEANHTLIETYVYQGPYEVVSSSDWEISGDAIFGSTGIFNNSVSSSNVVAEGTEANLFPRAIKRSMNAGVEHLSSSNNIDARAVVAGGLVTSGDTAFMDGSSERVTTNNFLNENISSCNVTALVEVVYKDPSSNAEVVLSSSKEIKLQLIKSSDEDFNGIELLYSALNSCSGTSQCGASECCFNQRCWSKNIVSQCIEDNDQVGNKGSGEVCASDYECASLCCNTALGTCGVHKTDESNPVLCGKTPGERCVEKEYCKKENVQKCFIVKTTVNPDGQQQCAKRCYNVPTHGDCINGICRSATPEAPPVFDELNPDCSNAIDPPTGF